MITVTVFHTARACRQAVFTGTGNTLPVTMAREHRSKMRCTPVFTARVTGRGYGPCARAVFTGHDHE